MFHTKPLARDASTMQTRTGFTLIELLVVITITGVLAWWFLTPVTRSRESARSAQCKNSLKHIGMALQAYEAEYGTLPPAYTVDEHGKPLHSWRTLILPYLDQQDLYRKIDLSQPWDDPANAAVSQTTSGQFYPYTCPSVNLSKGHTTYLAVVTPESCIQPDKPRRLSEVSGGRAGIVMLVEVDDEHAVPWMAPRDANESLLTSISKDTKLPHHGGRRVTYVDGSIGTVEANRSADQWRAMISITNAGR